MSHFKLSLRLLLRGAGGRSAAMLLFSLTIAVAVVACLTLTTDRLQQLIYSKASSFLAADAHIYGAIPAPENWLVLAESQSLAHAQAKNFRAMLFGKDEAMQLGSIKAVNSHYPLKGELLVADQPFAESTATSHGPQSGSVWLTSRLFAALNVAVGDSIGIGDAEFTVAKALIQEPDNPQSVMGFAPRALIHFDDVAKTGAVALGSRVDHTLMLAGDKANLAKYQSQVKDGLDPHFRWRSAGEGEGADAGIFQRITSYVLLVGSLALVLGAVAIALAADEFAKSQNSTVALLKTLGLGPKAVVRIFAWQLVLLTFVGCLLGLCIGWLFHQGLLLVIVELIQQALPAPGLQAWLLPVIGGSSVLLAFAGPRFWALRSVSPVTALRSVPAEIFKARYSLPGVVVITLLVAALSGQLAMTLIAAGGLLIAFYAVRFAVMLLFKPLANLQARLRGPLRLGLGQWLNYRSANATQATVFGLIFMVLFSVYSSRTQLLEAWQQQVPEGAPNHFIFNIFEHQKVDIEAFIAEYSNNVSPYYPMARGRVTQVNSLSWQSHLETSNNESRANYERELNLTWANELQSDNEVVAGQWWSPVEVAGPLLVSIEQEYAKGANIHVGDQLKLSLSGQEVVASVTNIRTLNWQSLRPNFFIIFNRIPAPYVASNWITSFYLSPDQKPAINTLLKRFPAVTLIEVDQTLNTLKTLIDQLGFAVEYLLLLMVLAAFAVLLASILVTLPVRLKVSALMRAFGASQWLVRWALWVEFMVLGCIAGLVAAIGNELLIRFWLAKALELEDLGLLGVWLWGIPLSALVLSVVGVLATRSTLRVAPSQLLKGLA